MSAAELFKQVKTLPAPEREKFLLAVLNFEEEMPRRSDGRKETAKWPDVEARAKPIFGERVLPNLVLLERKEAAS